jgi:TonB-dependent starch-binding outer membrane protein SusC
MANLSFFSGNRKRFSKLLTCKLGFTILFVSITTFAAYAQQIIISGKILDERSKVSVIGANIRFKGGTGGTVSDVNGSFSLKVKSLPVTLLITSIDYKYQEIDVYEAEPTTIYLTEDLNRLNSVVVVGYGTQKRSDLTGSIGSVSKDLLKQPTSSFERTLQGAVAGIQVTQSSGQPGATSSIRIRGSNSINGGSEPLYVIDGFPIYNDNSTISSGALSGGSINGLSSINSSDIESIDILKDASATAIYGSRGANGVVLITTKKGKAGKSVISYEASFGVQKVIHPISVLTDSKEWARIKNEALINKGKAAYYTDEQIAALPAGTDWQAAAFRNAQTQNHQLQISGGDEKTKYAISGSYFNQDGVLLNTNFKRYSGRINLDRTVTSKLKVGTNLTASKIESQIADVNVVSNLILMPPVEKIRDESGAYTYQSTISNSGNPIATLEKEINYSTTYRFLGNIFGDYDLGKGFTAKVSFGTDVTSNKENSFIPSTIYQGANTTAESKATVGIKTSNTWLNENTLSYTKNINNNHTINVLAGYTQQAFRSENALASSQGFITNLLTYNNLGSAPNYNQPSSGSTAWALNSYLSRINYSYKEKYFLTVSARADGSSRFGETNKWGYFPSAAFSWNLKNEKFIHLPKAINNLKLRASSGITGNQEIGQYKSLATLSSDNYYFGGTQVVGFYPNTIKNADLRWEKTTQHDAGFDFGLLNDQFTLSLDGYYKKTNDLLLNVPIPYTSGQSSALLNYGSVSNKGFELTFGTHQKFGKLQWNSNITYSINRNKVLSLGKGVDYIISGVSIVKVGQPLGTFYGLKTDGVFQSTDDIAKLPVYLTKNQPGDQRYKNLDSDSANITLTGDRTTIGSAQPDFITGFSNQISYGNFDLNFLFQGSYGNKVYNQNNANLESLSGFYNVPASAVNRWTATNPSNNIPRAYEDQALILSDRNIEDASYLRLKVLTLGYSLPKKIISKIGLSELRFYVTGQNLLTLTNYSGFDPEVSSNGQSNIGQGVDYGSYPSSKTISGGFSIKF